jgi:membrane peptidoglycan carboxypeptidase
MFDLSDKRPVAAKTGTQQGGSTQDTLANWQFMYTPQLVTGGWVGNADRRTWTDRNGGANAVGYSVQQLEDLINRQYQIPIQPFVRPPDVVSIPVHVPDASVGQLGGCGPIQSSLFAQGRAPDVNNRICANGAIIVPPEQVGTGGLSAHAILPPPPTPTPGAPTATPAPFILPQAPPQFIWPQGQQPTTSPTPLPTQPGNPYPGTGSTPPPGVPTAQPTPARTATPVATATPKTGP